MAEETITIYRVDTGEAVKSVNDLKNNVKLLKEQLGDLDIGSKEYQNTLDELKVNQAAMKDAMYATSASMDDLTKAATGTSETYNGLVHRMAQMKEGLRNIDTSTKEGMEQFKNMAKEVDKVNSRLKEMDELQGNYQRSVGNYATAFKGWAENVDVFKKSLGAAKSGLNGIKDASEGLSKSPAIATFGILVSIFMKLSEELKDNETATQALKKGMDALKPVMDFLSGIVEKLADALADIIGKVATFVTSNGLFNKIINGVVGVGNAIVQYVVAPFKGVIAAIKVFQEEGVKGFRNAFKAFGNEITNGISFKQNFQTGQTIAETIISGAKTKKKDAQNAGTKIGEDIAKGVEKGLKEINWKKLLDTKDTLGQLQLENQKSIDEMIKDDALATQAFVEDVLNTIEIEQENSARAAEMRMQERLATMEMVAGATSSIFGTIADLYEQDEENSEKNARKVKALRIAGATIDTISGGISAFMSVWKSELPLAAKSVLAPLQSAAVVVAGVKEIAKIKSTSVTGGSSGNITPAVASAPSVNMDIPQIRSITTASEEDRLNQMASDQRVVLVTSDLEVKQNQQRVLVQESTF